MSRQQTGKVEVPIITLEALDECFGDLSPTDIQTTANFWIADYWDAIGVRHDQILGVGHPLLLAKLPPNQRESVLFVDERDKTGTLARFVL